MSSIFVSLSSGFWFLSLVLSLSHATFSLALHAGCSSHAFEFVPTSLCAECGSVFSFLCLLLSSVFLQNAAVFVDLALYLAAGLPRWSFLALFLSNSPARDLQHVSWRLRFCLLQVGITAPGDCVAVCSRSGIGMFWTLLRVIVWVICAFHGTCGVAAVFCATLISSLNSSSSPRQEVSRMFAFHLGQFSCRTRERQIRLVFAVISMRMSVSVCIQRLKLVTGFIQIRSFTILLARGKRASKFALSRSCCLR